MFSPYYILWMMNFREIYLKLFLLMGFSSQRPPCWSHAVPGWRRKCESGGVPKSFAVRVGASQRRLWKPMENLWETSGNLWKTNGRVDSREILRNWSEISRKFAGHIWKLDLCAPRTIKHGELPWFYHQECGFDDNHMGFHQAFGIFQHLGFLDLSWLISKYLWIQYTIGGS